MSVPGLCDEALICPKCGSEQLSAHEKEKDAVGAAEQVILEAFARLFITLHGSGVSSLLYLSFGEGMEIPGAGEGSEAVKGFWR